MRTPISGGDSVDTMLPYPPALALARTPTPLVRARRLPRLDRPGMPTLFWKRDDLTGSALTGNKVRKLDFLLAEALAQGADVIVTCGGEQSNHCRATAVAARELGLDSLLLLRTADPAHPPALEANSLIDRLVGAELRWVSRPDYQRRQELFVEVAAELRAQGRRPYVIPEGGSNALGAWGYVRCVEELVGQLGSDPLTLVYAAGSGGTGAGLLLGVRLLGLPWRVVGFNVCDDRAYFVRVIGDLLDDAATRWRLPVRVGRDEIELIDGYVGRGYAQSRPEELAAMTEVARTEGVLLDPVYSGKAWFGLSSELERDPRAFGDRVVFLCSGGLFGLFPSQKAQELAAVLG